MLSTDLPRRIVPVALVYQSEALNAHVREAMTELGARVVYESSVLAYRSSELGGSGAEVIIVNLDPASDDDIGALDDLLVDNARRVVFNDGEVTAKLSGWDLARWARHLAAKVLGQQVSLPPRPEGAESIPQAGPPRSAELSTPDRPRDMEPTTRAGSNAENDEVADEMTRALAGFSMEKAAAAEQEAAHDDLSASLAGLGLGDFGMSLNAEPAAPPVRINESKSIFEELGLNLDLGSPPALTPKPQSSEPEDDNPFSGLDINFDAFDAAPPVRDEPQGLDALLASLPKERTTESTDQPQRSDRSSAPTLELPAIPPIATARKPAEVADNPFAGLSLELAPIDGAVDVPAAAPAESKQSNVAVRDFSSALASLSLAPLEDLSAPASFAPAAAAAPGKPKPAVTDNPFAGLSLSLEPLNDELPAVPAAPSTNAAAAPVTPPPLVDDNPFADLALSLDSVDAAPAVSLQRESMAETSSEDDFMREFAALGALDQSRSAAIEHVVILGASIGGPDAVREFLSGVTGNKSTVFVLAQHMGADFVDLMAQQLQRATRLNVLMPQAGQSAKAGDILIVPVAERMLLEPSGEIRLTVPDQASPYSPSIDQVLFDIADRFGDRAMAIIFSGMAHDAIEGAKYLAGRGGRIWVQDPATCVVSSMIDGAIEAGVVSFIGSPTDLAQQFNREFK